MKKVLIFGQTGQVARELARHVPAGIKVEFLGRERADLGDPISCAAAIMARRPEVVINAAAWTGVDAAEASEDEAMVVNAEAPGAMARACASRGLPFLHISSDYVFDGAGDQPFAVDHPTAPLGAYGRSKLAGEELVLEAGGLILRTSWVFSAHGANFVKTMLRLGIARDSLNVVADQIGGPTPAADIARALYVLAQTDARGIVHFAGAPDVSWADFARAVMAGAGLPCQIKDISSADYPTPAKRPMNSRLDCSGLERIGLERPDWRAGLADVLKELNG